MPGDVDLGLVAGSVIDRGADAPYASCVVHVVSCPEADTPGFLRTQVRAAQEQAWPSQEAAQAASLDPVHDPALRPVSLLLVHGDEVLSALDLLFKTIEHAGAKRDAVGLSTVVTPAAHRGQGHGHQLVSYARRTVADRGVDVALFTCDRPLERFYTDAGWETLPGTVLVGGTATDPLLSDSPGMDKATLGAFLTPRAARARTAFIGGRILLHSGAIDRLW